LDCLRTTKKLDLIMIFPSSLLNVLRFKSADGGISGHDTWIERKGLA
jgi:hypothetical protein